MRPVKLTYAGRAMIVPRRQRDTRCSMPSACTEDVLWLASCASACCAVLSFEGLPICCPRPLARLGRPAIREMFEQEFAVAHMVCIPEIIYEAGDVAILEWRDPLGLRGCGFFTVRDGRIAFQRGYWDRLSFLQAHSLLID